MNWANWALQLTVSWVWWKLLSSISELAEYDLGLVMEDVVVAVLVIIIWSAKSLEGLEAINWWRFWGWRSKAAEADAGESGLCTMGLLLLMGDLIGWCWPPFVWPEGDFEAAIGTTALMLGKDLAASCLWSSYITKKDVYRNTKIYVENNRVISQRYNTNNIW